MKQPLPNDYIKEKLTQIREINKSIKKNTLDPDVSTSNSTKRKPEYQDIQFNQDGNPTSIGNNNDINRLKKIVRRDYPHRVYPYTFTDKEINEITETYNRENPENKKTNDYIKFHLDKLYLGINKQQRVTSDYIKNKKIEKEVNSFFAKSDNNS